MFANEAVHFPYGLDLSALFGVRLFFSFIVVGWRCLHHESENSQIPLRSPGNVPSPDLPHAVHFQNPFPPSLRFPITKRAQTCNISSQMFWEQILCYASVSTFPALYHMCGRGNNTALCCSLMADRMFLGPAVCVIVLPERKQRRKGVSHSA